MSSSTVDKNSVVKTYNNSKFNSKSNSKSNFITSDEFDKEGDEYTQKALQELEKQMKETPVNTNINIKKSHDYNLRNRKKKSNSKIINDINDTTYVLNSESEDEESDMEVNKVFQNMLITNAQNALDCQNTGTFKRKRDSTFPKLSDEDTDVNMTKLMMGQREIELQKNMNLMGTNADLKGELINKEVQLHYMKLELLNNQTNLSEIKDEITKYKIILEQEIKSKEIVTFDYYKSIFLNCVLLLIVLYLSVY